MSPFTTVFLVAACAALLVGSDARQHGKRPRHVRAHRRNANDASVALGTVGGSDALDLPPVVVNGPDVILGFPNNCDRLGAQLAGTLVVVSNNDQGGLPPQLSANDLNNAQSNLNIQCDNEDDGSRCVDGVTVTAYQFCSLIQGRRG